MTLTGCLLVLNACGGSGTSPNGGGGGGGGGGNVTITGWSPEKPYLGETITINGTGFSTVPSENVVKLAACRFLCNHTTYTMTVTAATATQLTVSLPWNYPSGTKPQAATLRVIVEGDTATATDEVFFKFPVVLGGHYNYDFLPAPGYAVRPGDYIKVDGFGLIQDLSQVSLVVDGEGITIDSVHTQSEQPATLGLEGVGNIWFRLPTKIYDAGYPRTDLQDDTAFVKISLTVRGRTDTMTARAWRFPRSQFNQSVGGTFTTAGGGPVEVTGKNMPGPFAAVFAATDTIRQSLTVDLGANLCSTLCDTVQFSVPGGLEPGGYFVHLKLLTLVDQPNRLVGAISIE